MQKINDKKEEKVYFPVRSLPDEVQRHLEPSASLSTLYLSKMKNDSASVFKNKSEQEVDTLLACLIQSLKQETLKSISRELKECTRGYLPNADQFVSDYLMHDQKGNVQELTASVLITFIRRLRESETAYAEKGNSIQSFRG